MKKNLLLVFLGYSLSSIAQNTYLKIPDIVSYETTINHIVDSLNHRKKLNDYLVYQRISEANRIVSYLVCNKGKAVHLWIISRDTVIENRVLDKQAIFSYKNIAATGASKQEDKLKFKPPMLSVVNNEVVIYGNSITKVKFYFEYGDNITTYVPIPQKDVYRKRWLEIIRRDLL